MFTITTKLDPTCQAQPRVTALHTCADNIMSLSCNFLNKPIGLER